MVHESERGTFSDVQGSKATGLDFNEKTQISSKTCVINRVVPERGKFPDFQGSDAIGPDFSEKLQFAAKSM